MSRIIQIRDVSPELQRRLKARAAQRGQSLSSYVLAQIQRLTDRPPGEEPLQRLHQRAPGSPSISPAESVRAERDARWSS